MTFFDTNVVQPCHAIYPFLVSLGTTAGSTAEEHRPSSRLTLKTPLQTVCVTVSSIYLTDRPQCGHTHAFRLWVPSRLIQVGGCTHLVRSTRRSLSPAIRHTDMMRTLPVQAHPRWTFQKLQCWKGGSDYWAATSPSSVNGDLKPSIYLFTLLLRLSLWPLHAWNASALRAYPEMSDERESTFT